jgi:hypothetical protein
MLDRRRLGSEGVDSLERMKGESCIGVFSC